MKRFAMAALFLAVTSATAPAEAPPAVSPFARAIDAEIQSVEDQFVALAEAMPEGRFDYTPETLDLPGSDFHGVRTFAAQVKHVAADNFSIWAPIAGKPEALNLHAPNGPPEMKSRAEILKFLRDSFAYGHEAARNLTSENALTLVEFRGSRVSRLSLVVLALTHVNDHYGQLVEYVRMCGVVPPGSRPMKMS